MSEQRYTEYTREERPDFDERGEYSKNCPRCAAVNTVWTQYDHSPEYYTCVITECIGCREKIRWELPVN